MCVRCSCVVCWYVHANPMPVKFDVPHANRMGNHASPCSIHMGLYLLLNVSCAMQRRPIAHDEIIFANSFDDTQTYVSSIWMAKFNHLLCHLHSRRRHGLRFQFWCARENLALIDMMLIFNRSPGFSNVVCGEEYDCISNFSFRSSQNLSLYLNNELADRI